MALNPNMSNKDVANLVFLNYKTHKKFLDLDYANVTTTNLEATRDSATGGSGAPERVVFDSNRKGTLKIDTQISTMKLFSMLSGADILSTFDHIKKYELTASENKLTIPAGDTIVENSIQVFVDGDEEKEVAFTVNDHEITLTGTEKTVDFVVYALVNVKGQSVKFNAKTFPKAFVIYGSTDWKTEDDEIAEMYLTYYKAVPQSTFELAFSNTSIISMSITCDLLADKNDNIYDMSIADED